MEKLVEIFNFVFGCHHAHLSRVFTIDGRTYQVCCDCGAKFKYSLTSMRIERPIRPIRSLDAHQCGAVLRRGSQESFLG
jgi:hypothetical protein